MVYGKPEIVKEMGSKVFLEYYYLDSEMSDFCKENGISHTGSRQELKDRILSFLNGDSVPTSKFILKPEADLNVIADDMVIEGGLTFGEKHFRYFESAIGKDFIPYDDFIIWLEENSGKTYGDAVEFWYLIHDNLTMS